MRARAHGRAPPRSPRAHKLEGEVLWSFISPYALLIYPVPTDQPLPQQTFVRACLENVRSSANMIGAGLGNMGMNDHLSSFSLIIEEDEREIK